MSTARVVAKRSLKEKGERQKAKGKREKGKGRREKGEGKREKGKGKGVPLLQQPSNGP
jgi:hypothetical protein